jgi:transcriptional regulator with XRE-family HTH domain
MAAPSGSPLGDFIRRQRELQELSMRQMAELVGISNPYLSQIERGLREPSEKVVEAIARTLELSADALYEQSGYRRPGDGGEPEAEPEVVRAIKADRRLTARRRQALLEVYEAFTRPEPQPREAPRPETGEPPPPSAGPNGPAAPPGP